MMHGGRRILENMKASIPARFLLMECYCCGRSHKSYSIPCKKKQIRNGSAFFYMEKPENETTHSRTKSNSIIILNTRVSKICQNWDVPVEADQNFRF
jgi:hypothetical protein